MSSPSLIAIDWGTSNLRASLLDASGNALYTREAPVGVMAVKDRQFAGALQHLCGDWIERHPVPLIASGMIGSRQGWTEAPYLPCPSGIGEAAQRLTRIELAPQVALHIVPGLSCLGLDAAHDVMRGEETQLWGAGLSDGSCCILPGTHSKWAWMGAGGQVSRFQTYMTGELYALLTKHGILGRLMQFGSAHTDAFRAGVELGLERYDNATHVIFAARTAGLMSRMPPEALPDYLSGILIGIEIGSALLHYAQRSFTLLGDAGLCARYETALRIGGASSVRAAEGATTRGQWLIAERANLVKGAL